MPSLRELPPHALNQGAWSISKLGVLEQCTLRYDYKYGREKIKEEAVSQENVVGVVVHRALELTLGGFPQKHAFKQALAENAVLSDQVDVVWSFYDQVQRFVARFGALRKVWGVRDSTESVMIERKWGLTADFEGCDFFAKNVVFRGVVDYALLTAKNNLVIVDHKTGKEHDLAYYDAQFRAYCLLALAKNPSLKAVQTGINFVMNDRMAWSPAPVTAEQIREEYQPWLISYISKACEGLTRTPAPKTSKLCDWCGYKPICPAHGGAGRGDAKSE